MPADVRAQLVESFALLLLEDLETYPSLPCDRDAPATMSGADASRVTAHTTARVRASRRAANEERPGREGTRLAG
jgi:hypothetical protein